MSGEREVGNLFADAYIWYMASDIGFGSRGGYHGPGWAEGPVRVLDI